MPWLARSARRVSKNVPNAALLALYAPVFGKPRIPAKLEIPTAVIWGDADPWCPTDIADELAKTIPGAALTKIPHGMHFIAEHKPAEVTAALQTLLARPAAVAGLEAPLPPDPIPNREIGRASCRERV